VYLKQTKFNILPPQVQFYAYQILCAVIFAPNLNTLYLPLNDLQQPNIQRKQQDAEKRRVDQCMVAMDEDRDVEHVHDILMNSLISQQKQNECHWYNRSKRGPHRSSPVGQLSRISHRMSRTSCERLDPYGAIRVLHGHRVECVLYLWDNTAEMNKEIRAIQLKCRRKYVCCLDYSPMQLNSAAPTTH